MGFRLNTDGTTKQQKKIGGVGINDVVISVNELPDGTAASAIKDVSRELEKLREIARKLHLPNADRINWTLFTASTSDSASTQKCFNKLIEEYREKDELKFGAATLETVDIVESFCSMHLGVNLRKAYLMGIMQEDVITDSTRKYHPVDRFVHEFCKLFGKHGTPEYGCGCCDFPCFLKLMIDDPTIRDESRQYFQTCSTLNLHRQVGSRYFVSASNAARIVFLAEAAIQFLRYTGKENGNKLETELYAKLTDVDEMAKLRADALMYFHVYADLVMLSKSKELAKSVLDMNTHYLELSCFLSEVETSPEVIMDRNYEVFRSERELYGLSSTVNHRHHKNVDAVFTKLFEESKNDLSILYPMITTGAKKMKEKLLAYAEKQLPDGEYWNPEPAVRKLLMELKPSNDFCESILGLNDYLTTAIPNLTQASKSNLVQLKKNHTLQWLDTLPKEQQIEVLDLAVQEKPKVDAEQQRAQKAVSEQRQLNLFVANKRREAMKRKAQKERDELSEHHLITSSLELKQAMLDIDAEGIAASKKKSKKLLLLKTQIAIRKKVLKQNIRIPLSHSGQKRLVGEIVSDLVRFLDEHPVHVEDPCSLVGKRIRHKFIVADTHTVDWYQGTIVDYSTVEKKHKIQYDVEDEQCSFDLILDLLNGDLEVLPTV